MVQHYQIEGRKEFIQRLFVDHDAARARDVGIDKGIRACKISKSEMVKSSKQLTISAAEVEYLRFEVQPQNWIEQGFRKQFTDSRPLFTQILSKRTSTGYEESSD